MNLAKVHMEGQMVSAKTIATKTASRVTAIQLLSGGLLKEHITKTPAILLCVLGAVVYEDEKGREVRLSPGDFVEIEPMLKHWLKGVAVSQLLLIK